MVVTILLGVAVTALVMVVANTRDRLSQAPVYTAADLSQKAQDQLETGNYEQAELYLEQALQKEDDATYRASLAVVKYRLKKYDQAIEQYGHMIEIKKDEAFAYNGIGNAYRDWAVKEPAHSMEYQEKAAGAYRDAIAADSQYVAAYSNLALLLYGQGKKEEAVRVANEGIIATGSPELAEIKIRLQQ